LWAQIPMTADAKYCFGHSLVGDAPMSSVSSE